MNDTDSKKPTKRGTRPGSIRQVRLRLWYAVLEASDLLEHEDTEVKLKAISALSTSAGVYAKLTEAAEFESQITALQRELNEVRKATRQPQSAASSSQKHAVN